jgi:microcin C transport system substrate-binding protein
MKPIIAALLAALALPAGAEETIISAHGISHFGELKYPADFTRFDYVNPDAPTGGEFSTWAFGTFDTMHPFIPKGVPARGSSLQFEALLTGTADEPDSLYGLVAASMDYPEDRSWVTFHMRPEARFSDGTPLTADDVLFSFETLREKGLPSYAAILADVATAEVADAHTITFTFKDGVEYRELPSVVGTIPIFSRKDWEGRDFAESTMQAGIGSGEYILESFEPGASVTYRRRDDYWGKDLPVNVGTGNFDTIKYEYYADYNAAFEAFKAGAYTYREEASSLIWATGYDFPALNDGHVVKTELPDGGLGNAQGFMINLRKEKFADPRLRRALGMMFNFEWSNKTLFYGIYSRVTSFWPNSYLEAEGLPGPEELALLEPFRGRIPDAVFEEPAVLPPVSSEDQLDRALRREAGALLDAAGWPLVDGQRKNAAGEVLSVEFLNDNPNFDRIINPYVENLRQLGIDAFNTPVDPTQMENRQRAGDFDIVTHIVSTSLTSGAGLRQDFGSSGADEALFNVAGLKDPAIDELIAVVEAADDREALNTATRALDRVLRALYIWVPQWYKPVYTVAYLDIYDHLDPPPYALAPESLWWFNADKAAALKAKGAY